MRATDLFRQYHRKINPPYKRKDFLTVGATLLVLLIIPLTVIVALQARDVRKRAEGPETTVEKGAKPEVEFVSNEILVRVNKKAIGKIKPKPKPADTGITSLNKLNKSLKVKKFQRLSKPTKKSKNRNHEVFRWYKLTLPGKKEIIKGKSEGEAVKASKIRAALARFKKDPNIEKAHLNYIAHSTSLPNDTYVDPDQDGTWSTGAWGQSYEDLWGWKKINTNQVWDPSSDVSQGKGVLVAVVDSGLDYNHEDIVGNVWTNPEETPGNSIDDDGNCFIDDYYGFDFVNSVDGDDDGCYDSPLDTIDSDPIDDLGHGAHVAGTIAAAGNNSKGTIGVAPKAKIMAVKGLDENGSGPTDVLADAVIYAADNDADVINNSWGCGICPTVAQYEDAVSYAHEQDIVVIFAAHNLNDDVFFRSPNNLPETIVVSSFDYNDQKSDFSSYGRMVDVAGPGGNSGVPCSDVSAPNVLSTRASGTSIYDGFCDSDFADQMIVDNLYYRARGTSMAAPHVSGLAALIRAKHPDFTNEEVRQVLRVSADDVDEPGFDVNSGYGRINAAQALSVDSVLQVMITSPRPWTDLQGLDGVEISGTANGSGFVNYQLSYGAGLAPTEWVGIGSSSTPKDNESLGTWDVASLETNYYTLRLSASDGNRTYESYISVLKEDVFPISTRSGTQEYPAISVNQIVWEDRPTGGDRDIYFCEYDSASGVCEEEPVTNDSVEQRYPAVSDGLIVWQDYRNDTGNDNTNIYLYDLSSNQEWQITFDTARQERPAVSGNIIVWEDYRDNEISGANIYYCIYESSTGSCQNQPLISATRDQRNPDIDGDKVVWEDLRNDDFEIGSGDIYLYNLSTNEEIEVTTHARKQEEPSISGSRVVWVDRRHGYRDIFYRDIDDTGGDDVRITDEPEWQYLPDISGDLIVWQDYRITGNFDIYLYDLTNDVEKRLTLDLFGQRAPAIFGNKVVWSDTRNFESDIYITELRQSNQPPSLQIIKPDVPYWNATTQEFEPPDGDVSLFYDIFSVAFFFGRTCTDGVTDPPYQPAYDMNGDCEVDLFIDIFTVMEAFGFNWPPDDGGLQEGGRLHFWVKGTDPDPGDTLTYSVSGLPGNASLNSTTGEFSWTPTSTQSGDYTATFTVNDGNGGTDTKTLPIKVTDVP